MPRLANRGRRGPRGVAGEALGRCCVVWGGGVGCRPAAGWADGKALAGCEGRKGRRGSCPGSRGQITRRGPGRWGPTQEEVELVPRKPLPGVTPPNVGTVPIIP